MIQFDQFDQYFFRCTNNHWTLLWRGFWLCIAGVWDLQISVVMKPSRNDFFANQTLFVVYMWEFPKMVVPNNYWFSYQKLIILGCFGVPPFKETAM